MLLKNPGELEETSVIPRLGSLGNAFRPKPGNLPGCQIHFRPKCLKLYGRGCIFRDPFTQLGRLPSLVPQGGLNH